MAEPFQHNKQAVITFHSNGKLLLTGEYFVLEGALALAVPTQAGQSLTVQPIPDTKTPVIVWQSLTPEGDSWFSAQFNHSCFEPVVVNIGHEQTAHKLQQILQAARLLNPHFPATETSLLVSTQLEFNGNWGLGSSSTLISNIAQWAQVNPYSLQFATFGGSGYDIACAMHNTPLVYQKSGNDPVVVPVNFHPPFSSCLYFVYLGKKQNSRLGIQHFYELANKKLPHYVQQITDITRLVAASTTLPEFETLLNRHEIIVSEALSLQMIKTAYFSDFWGTVKSLGAWGGDFVLACSEESPETTRSYFYQKGYNTVIPYGQMVKKITPV